MVPSIKDVIISHQVNNKIEPNILPTIEDTKWSKLPIPLCELAKKAHKRHNVIGNTIANDNDNESHEHTHRRPVSQLSITPT